MITDHCFRAINLGRCLTFEFQCFYLKNQGLHAWEFSFSCYPSVQALLEVRGDNCQV